MGFTVEDLADAYDLSEFARAIGTSRRTAERIVQRGEVDYVRTGSGRGSKVKIPRRAANDYINRQAVIRRSKVGRKAAS